MRKVLLVLVGAVLGALSWQVGIAEPALDTLVVCERSGTDLRSPAANGSCPSGYTKKEISETAPNPVVAYNDEGVVSGASTNPPEGEDYFTVVSVQVPEGDYTVVATGNLVPNLAGAFTITCRLEGAQLIGETDLHRPADWAPRAHATLSGVESIPAGGGTIRVRCTELAGAANGSFVEFALTATPVDDVVLF